MTQHSKEQASCCPPAMQLTGTVLSVQVLRGIAALLVVVHHSQIKGQQAGGHAWGWFDLGWAGVDLFFIISGYIMMCVTDSSGISPYEFIKRRLLRIIPLYWLLSGLGLAIYLVLPERINSSGGTTLIWNSFLLIPGEGRFLINNAWTLSYEFLYYLLLMTAMMISSRHFAVIAAVGIAGLTLVGYMMATPTRGLDFVTRSILLEFNFGMIAYWILSRYRLEAFPSVILVALGVICLILTGIFGGALARVVSVGLPFLMIFIGTVSQEGWFRSVQGFWLMRFWFILGASSYSLYLLHPFVQAGMYSLNEKILTFGLPPMMLTILMIPVSTAFGIWCFRYIEVPLDGKLRRLLALPRTAAMRAS